MIIGHQEVVNHYIQRYEEFSNPELEFSNRENLTQSEFMMNETVIDTLLNSSSYANITFWDKRLFVYEYGIEMKGFIILNEEGNVSYIEVGSNRTAYVPVLGVQFKDYISNWHIIGSVENASNSAVVGDTLADNMFEAATAQKIRLQNITTSEFNITGVFFDSFCRGSAVYVHLNALQQDFNLENSVNLVIIQVSPSASKDILISNLQIEINSIMGPDFVVMDLTPTFENNIRSLYPFVIISTIVIIIETIIIIASLYFYQSGNFQEKTPDFVIIKGIGGNHKLVKSILFFEDLALLMIASSISLGVSLLFNSVFLYEDALLPPIWLIFLLWIIISAVIIGIVRISIFFLYKQLDILQKEILKDFSRAK